MTNVDITELESADEVIENVESWLVLDVHIGVAPNKYNKVWILIQYVLKKVSELADLFYKLGFLPGSWKIESYMQRWWRTRRLKEYWEEA